MSHGVRQKGRLFLEGREVPFVSATVICQPNQPMVAQIDLVPLQTIKFIRPRTKVEVFVEDNLNFGDTTPRLMFEGEVIGRGMDKAQDSRSSSITAADLSMYWREARAYYYNPNFLVGKVEETVTGDPGPAATAKFADAKQFSTLSTVTSVMINQMLSQSNQDLVDGVVHVLKSLSNTNIYYSAAYDRLRMTDRIRFMSTGRLKEFLHDIDQQEFLASYTGKMGGMVSLLEMLVNVLQLVFHDYVSVPFPSLLPANSGSGKVIGSFMFIPDSFTLPPPKCNVIFPSQQIKFSFTDDFTAAPTRYGFRPSLPQFIAEKSSVSTYQMIYYPQSVSDFMFNKGKKSASASDTSLLGPSSIFKDSKGHTFSSAFFGGKKTDAVGQISISPTLREADFLTNEESIRGVFPDTDVFAPSVTALAKGSSIGSSYKFFHDIGQYLFFKKKYSARNASAELLFNPFLVPGFNCVLLDDSDAGQSIIAKLQSVTHNITNNGCSTAVQLGLARDFDEVDALTGDAGDPPLPAWFDPSIFGSVDPTAFKQETAYLQKTGAFSATSDEKKARDIIKNPIAFPKVSKFFQYHLGTDAITDFGVGKSKLVSTRGAVTYLADAYRKVADDPKARDTFVYNYISRHVATMKDSLNFLGAKPAGTTDAAMSKGTATIPEEFATFVAVSSGTRKGRYDGTGYPDENVLKIRRAIIDKYVALLRTKRGYRG